MVLHIDEWRFNWVLNLTCEWHTLHPYTSESPPWWCLIVCAQALALLHDMRCTSAWCTCSFLNLYTQLEVMHNISYDACTNSILWIWKHTCRALPHTHTCGCYVLTHNVLSMVLVLQMTLADDHMVAYAMYDLNLHVFVTSIWFVLYVPLWTRFTKSLPGENIVTVKH